MKLVHTMIVLVLADVLGILMGYAGIARLHLRHFYPFWGERMIMGAYNMMVVPPPALIIYAWDSLIGRVLLIVGSIVVPVWASVSIYRNQHIFWAIAVMLVWTLATGGIGVWILMHAMINVL